MEPLSSIKHQLTAATWGGRAGLMTVTLSSLIFPPETRGRGEGLVKQRVKVTAGTANPHLRYALA